jgi:hypothetical protein
MLVGKGPGCMPARAESMNRLMAEPDAGMEIAGRKVRDAWMACFITISIFISSSTAV